MQPCKSCGEAISAKASACPKCGHPVARPVVTQVGIALFWLAAIAIIGYLLLMVFEFG